MGKKKYIVSSSQIAKYNRMDAPFQLFVISNVGMIEGLEVAYPGKEAAELIGSVSEELFSILDPLLPGSARLPGKLRIKARETFCKKYPYVALAKVMLEARPLCEANLKEAEEARDQAQRSLEKLIDVNHDVEGKLW